MSSGMVARSDVEYASIALHCDTANRVNVPTYATYRSRATALSPPR